MFAMSSDEASKLPYYLITSKDVENISGKYFVKFKQTNSSSYSRIKLLLVKCGINLLVTLIK